MNALPQVARIKLKFEHPKIDSLEKGLQAEFQKHGECLHALKGKSIAVAVGSRGITHLDRVVHFVISRLQEAGAKPFILPAMGSHGGGTEEGQRKLLADYGITEEQMGIPVDARLQSRLLEETPEGIPVSFSQAAYEADGVVLINRIKPHTDFHGQVESGLMKMIAIGLGKIEGAKHFHSRTHLFESDRMILSLARPALATGKIIFGLALLENADHETAQMELIPATEIENREKELLERARNLMPSLPVEKADILVVDEIGKNISGTGMDPNITGRRYHINRVWQETPNITRVIIRDLTEASKGNAAGIGLADFCHQRVVEKMDRRTTYLNAIISRNTPNGAIPMYFDSDSELLKQTLLSLGDTITPENVRLLRIRNTLELKTLQVSKALLPELEHHPNVQSVSDCIDLEFDSQGNWIDELDRGEKNE